MEFYAANFRYVAVTLPMFLGISLMFTGLTGKYNVFCRIFNSIVPYFFSFSPFGLLFYLLFKISHMQ